MHKGRSGGDAELFLDLRLMVGNCLVAEIKGLRNLAHRQALREQAEYFKFLGRERIRAGCGRR